MSEVSSFGSKAFKDFEHAGWERSSANYHDLFGTLTAQANEAILDATGIQSGFRMLDAPRGTGSLAAVASTRARRSAGPSSKV